MNDFFFGDSPDSGTSVDSGNDVSTDQGTLETDSNTSSGFDINPQELAAFRRWEADRVRFDQQQQPQVQAQQEQPQVHPDFLQLMQDPNAFKQGIFQEWEANNTIQQMQAKYPHLAPATEAILTNRNINEARMAFVQKHGRYPSTPELGEAAKDNFLKTIQGIQAEIAKQQTAAEMQKNALPLTVGNGQPQTKTKLTAEQISNLNDDQFAEFRRQAMRGT